MRLTLLGVWLVGVAVAPAAASAQVIRVSGTVLDETRTPIQGAIVRLAGDVVATTTAGGSFQFDSVVPGRYLSTVAAIGHNLQTIELTLTRDTSLTVVLTRRLATLDTMVVRSRNARIKATAVDSASGDYLIQAQATLYPGGRFLSAASGVVVFDSVAPGPTTIVFEALEHLPKRIELDLTRDTVLTVKLGVDSVALRMIAMQVKRLEQRSHSIPMVTKSLNRDQIKRDEAGSVAELILRRLYEEPRSVRESYVNAPEAGCFFLDDVKVSRGAYEGVLPEQVERIEIYRSAGAAAPRMAQRSRTERNFGGVAMVRVYTRRFVAAMPRESNMPRILYSASGLRPSCS